MHQKRDSMFLAHKEIPKHANSRILTGIDKLQLPIILNKNSREQTMPQTHDRYVNNELLGFISRPQYTYSCSMSALTAVINYLFSDQIGIKTTKEWAKDIGIQSPETSMSPENKTVMEWFNKVCKCYGLQGSCDYYIQSKDLKNWDNNPRVITKLKEAIKSDNQALIYHMQNHYNVVIGYFEHSANPDDAYDKNAEMHRWIILGEHSIYNPMPKVIQKAMQELPAKTLSKDYYNIIMERVAASPVWCRRWGSIRNDLINTPNHCILSFQK